jgi:hypothetical protein
MKRYYSIIVLGLFWVQIGFAQDGLSDLFNELGEMKNVMQVTITKSMMNLLPDMNFSVESKGVNIKNIIDKLDQIDVFSTKDEEIKQMMADEASDYFEKNKKTYATLMVVKDEKDNAVFYGKKDGNLFSSLVMLLNDGNRYTIIRLLGRFTPQDIQEITKKVKK